MLIGLIVENLAQNYKKLLVMSRMYLYFFVFLQAKCTYI